MGRSLRSVYSIKNRQPLRAVELVTKNIEEKAALLEMEEIVREELNVKKVGFSDKEDDLVEYEAKANFRVLGKELGKDMQAAGVKIATLGRSEIQALLDGATLSLDIGTRSIDVTADRLNIRRIEKTGLRVANEGSLTVALDTEITPELLLEGEVKDLVRGIQNERKESGLEVTDRIKLSLFGSPQLKTAWEEWADYISSETLATSVEWKSCDGQKTIEAGDENWLVSLEKA